MTDPARPSGVGDVDYKGAPLDPARGPGLGCFWIQVIVLGVLVVLTPLSVGWGWPFWASGTLLIVVLLLLLFAGQTVIFLLRLVAAERRDTGRRRPLASTTPTVGELEDGDAQSRGVANESAADDRAESSDGNRAGLPDGAGPSGGGVRE